MRLELRRFETRLFSLVGAFTLETKLLIGNNEATKSRELVTFDSKTRRYFPARWMLKPVVKHNSRDADVFLHIRSILGRRPAAETPFDPVIAYKFHSLNTDQIYCGLALSIME